VTRRPRNPRSLLYAVTVPSVAYSFLRGQLAYMAAHGWSVTLACSPGRGLDGVRDREGVEIVQINTERDIDVRQDVLSFIRWVQLLRRLRPAVLNASTPKAALLSLLAARLTGVPTRIYLVRGLRLETESGLRRRLLMFMERLSSWSATHVVAVSPSLRDELVSLRLTCGHDPIVLANGSSNGVDVQRIAEHTAAVDRSHVRNSLGIGADEYVVSFIGRMRPEKGALELAEAMGRPELSKARLVTLGDIEDIGALKAFRVLGERHVALEWRDDIYDVLAISDTLALPSHREGFPNVVLEAAAAGVPAVTSDATGAVDSVVHEVTGLVVPTGNAAELAAALARLGQSPGLRRAMGAKARERVVNEFDSETVWQALANVYAEEGGGRR
jgi:glycosyltransferase involved in cell wall biosynthesis